MNLSGKKILIVDDEIGIRMTLEAYLEDFDAELKTAEDSNEAISILADWLPNLIITDLNLPGLSGEDFIRSYGGKVQADHFIISTGDLSYSLPDDLIAMGMTEKNILKKPIYPLSVLSDLLESLL